ncbi:hypothetical protein SDC9_74046 [bioreactor metagenome]|uniref:Uncharacterized protein n=1 Tax=bioreactor metagenome TaxID=1076179 RepID=A0A644YN65_9ZZZZ
MAENLCAVLVVRSRENGRNVQLAGTGMVAQRLRQRRFAFLGGSVLLHSFEHERQGRADQGFHLGLFCAAGFAQRAYRFAAKQSANQFL